MRLLRHPNRNQPRSLPRVHPCRCSVAGSRSVSWQDQTTGTRGANFASLMFCLNACWSSNRFGIHLANAFLKRRGHGVRRRVRRDFSASSACIISAFSAFQKCGPARTSRLFNNLGGVAKSCCRTQSELKPLAPFSSLRRFLYSPARLLLTSNPKSVAHED